MAAQGVRPPDAQGDLGFDIAVKNDEPNDHFKLGDLLGFDIAVKNDAPNDHFKLLVEIALKDWKRNCFNPQTWEKIKSALFPNHCKASKDDAKDFFESLQARFMVYTSKKSHYTSENAEKNYLECEVEDGEVEDYGCGYAFDEVNHEVNFEEEKVLEEIFVSELPRMEERFERGLRGTLKGGNFDNKALLSDDA